MVSRLNVEAMSRPKTSKRHCKPQGLLAARNLRPRWARFTLLRLSSAMLGPCWGILRPSSAQDGPTQQHAGATLKPKTAKTTGVFYHGAAWNQNRSCWDFWRLTWAMLRECWAILGWRWAIVTLLVPTMSPSGCHIVRADPHRRRAGSFDPLLRVVKLQQGGLRRVGRHGQKTT